MAPAVTPIHSRQELRIDWSDVANLDAASPPRNATAGEHSAVPAPRDAAVSAPAPTMAPIEFEPEPLFEVNQSIFTM
jgi:hypothetical protein